MSKQRSVSKLRTKFSNARTALGKPATTSRAFILDADGAGATPDRVWVQVAMGGVFKGYAGGSEEFTFDTRTFEQLVGNFRKHPNYRVGDDGFGVADVVAWDFHHASEMPATEGTIPVHGSPAQGWIQELAVRHNEQGVPELWALTRWLEPAKTYIKEGRYQWASVSVVFDAIDPRTGQNIGALLTSVALTNTPFIEGMQRLSAERYLRSRDMYIEAADTPERALEMIRAMLGMPETADAGEVVGELEKVKAWTVAGAPPLGVDIEEILGGLRTVLNLPSLSTPDEVFAEVDKLIARLIGDSGVDAAGQPAVPEAPAATPQPPPDFPAPQLERTMELQKVIAEKLGVVAKPEVIVEALDQLLELRNAAAEKVGLDKNAALKVVLKATLDDSGVRAKYVPLLQALGVEDPDAALDKVAKLMQESAELAKVAPEFASLKQRMAEVEQAEEEEEIEAAVSSTGVAATSEHYEGIKVALSALRKSNKEEFYKRYPKEKLKASRSVPQRTSKEVTTLTTQTTKANPAESPNGGAGGKIDVSGYKGANTILRTCEFVRATVQGADKWDWGQVHQHATALVRSGQVSG